MTAAQFAVFSGSVESSVMFRTLTLRHGFAVVYQAFEHFACGLLFTVHSAADCTVIAYSHKARKLTRMLFELN
jgi:hypothetical protein